MKKKIINSTPYGLFMNSIESRFQSQSLMYIQAKTIKHKRKKLNKRRK